MGEYPITGEPTPFKEIYDSFLANITDDLYLNKGTHSIKIEYFQRYGPLGLEASYKQKNSNQIFLIGQDSKNMKFITE